jgi:ribulose-phosphate 3-epimerase
VLPHLESCDLVLVMSVNPGFGGQQFNSVALEKLEKLKAEKPDNVLLEVDGGVNSSTIARCADAGAELLVVGSAIFQQADYRVAVDQLHSLLA